MARRSERKPEHAPETRPGCIRLDKWLWFARFQRAREACATLVRDGRVRINSRRVTQPGADVAPGDVLTLALPGRTIVVEILAIAERRGDSAAGQALFRIIEPHAPD
jgi:ribosome-associated heat shock protein Hsp15